MRFLALETSLQKLKNQFLAEGEEELMSTKRHFFVFLFPLLWILPLTAVLLFGWATIVTLGLADVMFITFALYIWFLAAAIFILHAFIAWQYNFLIVTTEKIVIITHVFIFKQSIRPISTESIANIRTESRYLGIGRCGDLWVNLTQLEEGSSREVLISSLTKPEVVAGVIENARVLKKQRAPADKGPAEQTEKVQDAQQKAQEEIQK